MLADVLVRSECELDAIRIRARRRTDYFGDSRKARGRIDADVAIGRDKAGSEGERGNVAFTHSAQAQDEAPAADGRTRLIGMADNTRIEQRRRLEGILMQEIGAYQPALVLREGNVAGESLLHLIRA